MTEKIYTYVGWMFNGVEDLAVTISVTATSKKLAYAAIARYGIERVALATIEPVK